MKPLFCLRVEQVPLLVSCLALAGCQTPAPVSPIAAPQAQAEMSLAGCWEGQDYQPVMGASPVSRMHRRADGTFIITFSLPGYPAKVETGAWTLSGNTYTTLTRTIDGQTVDITEPSYTDEYVVEEWSPTSMTVRHPPTNAVFRSRKVACSDGFLK